MKGQKMKRAAGILILIAAAITLFSMTNAANAARLNTLVDELVNVRSDTTGTDYVFTIARSPRGWIYLANEGSTAVTLTKPDTSQMTVPLNTVYEGVHEAMLELPAGTYKIHTAQATNLIVRAVPELLWCYYNQGSILTELGQTTGAFEIGFIHPHVNCLVNNGGSTRSDWLSNGGQWLYRGSANKTLTTVANIKTYLSGLRSITDPNMSGLLLDEFGNADESICGLWAQAISELHAAGQPYVNRELSIFACGSELYEGTNGKNLIQTVINNGGSIALEPR